MAELNWKRLLKRWGDAILASGEVPTLAGATTAAFPPATDAAIAAAEARLGVRLPPSYRAFLKVSNGWWLDGTAGPIRMWGVEEIGRLGDLDPELVAIWGGIGGGDGDEDDPAHLPNDHLANAIKISEDNDGFYLLNPAIEPKPGEWQAAFFANWVPGAECHASFGAMMQKLCDRFIENHPAGPPADTAINFNKRPAKKIDDPVEFFAELRRLDFFRYATAEVTADIERNYLSLHARGKGRPARVFKGPFPSAGSAIFVQQSGRVVSLDNARLAAERAPYAVEMVRPLLAKAGIELGPLEDAGSANRHAVRLEGVEQEVFRLRNGRPSFQFAELEGNVAVCVAEKVVALVNNVLVQRGTAERICYLREQLPATTVLVDGKPERDATFRYAFVLVDDPLSYVLKWAWQWWEMLGACFPLRPDAP